MSFFDTVEREVRGFRRHGVAVSNFRLAVAETSKSDLGIESNRTGSAYAPLSATELSGGSFLVEWSDGRISRGALSRAPLGALRDVLASAFEGRYEDPDEAVFPGECEVPDVPLLSPEAAAVAEGRSPEYLPEVLTTVRDVAETHGVDLLDASAHATRTRRRVVSSEGFRGEVESTYVGFSLGYDSLVWDGRSRRSSPSLDEVREVAEATAGDYLAMRRVAEVAPRGPTRVVLHPRVAEDFLRTFLLGNLSGSAVANERSRFGAADFHERRRWFREDFSLSSHPLMPLEPGSYRFTDEGVPARDVEFVREGRLVTPSLGLKHARRLGMRPAPLPAAFEGFRLVLSGGLPREEALAGPEPTVLVRGVLGLHTQDAVRAEYSVLAPQSILYRDGVPRGRVSVTLNGTFFDDLQSPELTFVSFPGFAIPGIRVIGELS
jgi:predicted Zn-dependent protease